MDEPLGQHSLRRARENINEQEHVIILDYFRTVFVKIAKTQLTSCAVAVLNQVKII